MFTDNNIIGAITAFAAGALIAYVNYAISKYLLEKKPSLYPGGQIIRQIIQVGYLVLLFILGKYTPWDPMWLLVGGCLGITVPMFYFTYKLIRLNEKKKEDDSDGSQL